MADRGPWTCCQCGNEFTTPLPRVVKTGMKEDGWWGVLGDVCEPCFAEWKRTQMEPIDADLSSGVPNQTVDISLRRSWGGAVLSCGCLRRNCAFLNCLHLIEQNTDKPLEMRRFWLLLPLNSALQ